MAARLLGGVRVTRWMGVSVGSGCRIYTGNFGSEPWLIEIGDRVTVTGGVSFITHDGATWLARDERGRRYHYARIRVGSDVFIGLNAIIMPGVDIGDRVIVGAGSVVTRSVPPGVVIGGNPARILGTYKDFIQRALSSGPADADAVGGSYRQRVQGMLTRDSRPPLTGGISRPK